MALADEFQAFVFDLDGVLWHGEKPVQGADKAVGRLRSIGKRILFLTNNDSKSRDEYVAKLARTSIPAALEEVITSGYVTAEYLKKKHGPSRVYVIGSSGLKRELALAGHKIVRERPDYVVVGMDEGFTYDKLKKAFAFIRYDGAGFIAMNGDRTANREDRLVPVAGAIAASIAYAANRKPYVCGKPGKPMAKMMLGRLGVPPNEALMVGDSIESDIAFGLKAGLKTALVLSGVTSREDALASAIKPDYVLESVKALINP